MQELIDPRGDRTCGVCGQQRPAALCYGYTEDENGGGKFICVGCLREMAAKAPASVWHPLPTDAVEHRPPSPPDPPYPFGTSANNE